MKREIICKCPGCGRIFKETLFLFDHKSNQIFRKYCHYCKIEAQKHNSLLCEYNNDQSINMIIKSIK